MKQDVLDSVEAEFENADYRIAETKGLFDMVAAGENSIVVKILNNIDSATKSEALRLSAAASSLDAMPVFVGAKTRKGPIENRVYRRFGVPSVSLQGLGGIIHDKMLNYVSKGGSVVYVDGEKMRQRRERLGLSLGAISRSVGVSRKSIAEYENGGRARPEIAEKMENVLGTKITKNDLRAMTIENDKFRARGLEAFVNKKLKTFGFDTTIISKSIFNLAARHGEVIIANVSENTRNLHKKAAMLHDISEVTNKRAVLVYKRFRKNNVEGVPVITKDDLNCMGGLEDFEQMVGKKGR
ncbi:MAG: helix-turn-helix domain-containing protein [Candidatus Aenigmarchaeota archaeon]|nr:helix-turn-helix domain-containing protein [Candidatus Aenigmarchaeota archaeon]